MNFLVQGLKFIILLASSLLGLKCCAVIDPTFSLSFPYCRSFSFPLFFHALETHVFTVSQKKKCLRFLQREMQPRSEWTSPQKRTSWTRPFGLSEEAQPKCPVISTACGGRNRRLGTQGIPFTLAAPLALRSWPSLDARRRNAMPLALSADRSSSGVVPVVIMAYLRLSVNEEARREDEFNVCDLASVGLWMKRRLYVYKLI